MSLTPPTVVAHSARVLTNCAVLRLSCTDLQCAIGHQVLTSSLVISIGSEAARVLRKNRSGRVLACFGRSFYVQCEEGIICVGVSSLGEGPLHVLLASGKDQLLAQIATGSPIHLVGDLTQRSEGLQPFSGKISTKALTRSSLIQIQGVLKTVVPPNQQGFSWVVNELDWQVQNVQRECRTTSTAQTALRQHSFASMVCLSNWLEKSLVQRVDQCLSIPSDRNGNTRNTLNQSAVLTVGVPSGVSDLLGAGPGLTPAGDDLLAGVMLALHRVNCSDLADALWATLEPLAISRTNAISVAHLRLAARGQCAASVLELIECLFTVHGIAQCDRAQKAAISVQCRANRIGASSGWDMLAGMSLVLRAL